MSIAPRTAWRVFPWDPSVPEPEPFSPSYVAPFQGHGRFDLRDSPQGILYLAETPEHALGEKLQDLRNQPLDDEDLFELGHRYALSAVNIPESVFASMVDLCHPATVADLNTSPDGVAARSRATTQAIARRLYEAGYAGFRWWSSFFGEWHSLVIFRDRLPGPVVFSTPQWIDAGDPHLQMSAQQLGILLSNP